VAFYADLAPKAKINSFEVLDEHGAGYTSAVIRALQFVVENRERLHIDIVNLSLGHPVLEPADSDPLVMAVEQAVRSGLIVVVSAGNYGRPADGSAGYAGIMRSASARTICGTPFRDWMTRLPRSARAARPGTMRTPSLISSLLVRVLSQAPRPRAACSGDIPSAGSRAKTVVWSTSA
jgi:subtilisin family serine protease